MTGMELLACSPLLVLGWALVGTSHRRRLEAADLAVEEAQASAIVERFNYLARGYASGKPVTRRTTVTVEQVL